MTAFIIKFGYQRGELILVRVRASNSVGWGSFSSQNSAGVLTQTEPTFMSKPVLDYEEMRDTSIRINWSPITSDHETGAATIVSYSLEWDQANGSWQSLVGNPTNNMGLTFTVT
jgi:hypothetical protein